MSHGSFVESPKGSPGEQSGEEFHAGLDEIERRASAAVVEGESIEGMVEADIKREAGAEEENRRAHNGTQPEGEVGIALAENAMLPAAAKVIKTGMETLGEARSSAGNFSGSEARGLGASAGAESIDAAFTRMKKSSALTGSGFESSTKGRSLVERANTTAKSLGEQGGTNVGTKANEANSAQLVSARSEVQSLGVANQKVLSQVQAVRAENAHNIGAPTPGGAAPALRADARMAKGPAYISPEQAQRMAEKLNNSDGSTDWT